MSNILDNYSHLRRMAQEARNHLSLTITNASGYAKAIEFGPLALENTRHVGGNDDIPKNNFSYVIDNKKVKYYIFETTSV